MMTIDAVQIDVGGKQKFIFASNKLISQIGASHIIEHKVFKTELLDALKQVDSSLRDSYLQKWKNTQEEAFEICKKIEIAYIGGGNALLLFKSETSILKDKNISHFIRAFSKSVIQKYPGVQLEFGVIYNRAVEDLNVDFPAIKKECIQQIQKRKNENFVQSRPFKHGIFKTCAKSGQAQNEKWNKDYVSTEFYKKVLASSESLVNMNNILENNVQNHENYAFVNDLSELSSKNDKKYISVIHIDGNGLGQKFLDCKDLRSFRQLSVQVKTKLDLCLIELTKLIISKVVDHSEINDLVNINTIDTNIKARKNTASSQDLSVPQQAPESKSVIPFRSVVNAGDDITLVSTGELGLFIAEQYIALLLDENIGGLSIPSCAGVAIVGLKTPLYRAYHLAEELTQSAKKESRKIPLSCWLDFSIQQKTNIQSLEYIKEARKPAKQGPYLLHSPITEIFTFEEFKKSYDSIKKIPNNKLSELRRVLYLGPAQQEKFKLQLKYRGHNLPEEALSSIPYLDIIDIKHFYPEALMKPASSI